MKKLIDFDIVASLEAWVIRHQTHIKWFIGLFMINVFIFGQKVFFFSMATDDYGRFYNGGGELASWLGRWAAGWLNQNIFTGAIHMLPYFYQLVGIFSFTLAGYLTALLLNRTRKYEICAVTLLTSTTPMVAYNLYYNTNITAWISTLAGVIGFYHFQRSSRALKVFGFALLVVSIGCYQTIIQVILSISILQFIIGIMESKDQKDLKTSFVNLIYGFAFVALAFAGSSLINHLYILANHLEVSERMKTASESGFLEYYSRIARMFHSNYGFMFFSDKLLFLYKTMTLMGLVGAIAYVVQGKQKQNLKVLSSLIIVLMFVYIPIVINLPNITGNIIPLRAHYTVGWFLAGFFVIQSMAFKKTFRNLTLINTLSIVVVSTLYINLFYDGGTRQTKDDLARVNQIVARIRLQPGYVNEPIKFRIVGQKNFSVLGWNSDQQALYVSWPRYNIFQNFTDFKFEFMNDAEYADIEKELILKGSRIDSYPAKDSVYVKNGNAVLFLDTQPLNNAIMLEKIRNQTPQIKAEFDIFLKDGAIVYYKSPCSEDDLKNPFYLHVYPKDPNAISDGTDNIKMYFQAKGSFKDNACVAFETLPDFAIKQINTGQFSNEPNLKENKPYTLYWKSTLPLN